FFSSRRRHTRWPRDWSSDVCSSDLFAVHRDCLFFDRERMGDFMVWDPAKKQAVPMHRELVGIHMLKTGIDPALEGTYRVTLLDGKSVDVMPVFQMYKIHVQDFDLDTTAQITNTPKDLIVRWARDCGTIKPIQIHNGEGVAHWFHCTANGRGAAMITIVT